VLGRRVVGIRTAVFDHEPTPPVRHHGTLRNGLQVRAGSAGSVGGRTGPATGGVGARAWVAWSVGVPAYVLAVTQHTTLDAAARFDIRPGALSVFVFVQVAGYTAAQLPAGFTPQAFRAAWLLQYPLWAVALIGLLVTRRRARAQDAERGVLPRAVPASRRRCQVYPATG
jgi:hypothetical protein